jgi:hypothetical protein
MRLVYILPSLLATASASGLSNPSEAHRQARAGDNNDGISTPPIAGANADKRGQKYDLGIQGPWVPRSDAQHVNKCGASTFVKTTDPATSPQSADCEYLWVFYLNGALGGSWRPLGAGRTTLMSTRTCAFDVVSWTPGTSAGMDSGDDQLEIGDSDMAEVTLDAYHRFAPANSGTGGFALFLGASGEMTCGNVGHKVSWELRKIDCPQCV